MPKKGKKQGRSPNKKKTGKATPTATSSASPSFPANDSTSASAAASGRRTDGAKKRTPAPPAWREKLSENNSSSHRPCLRRNYRTIYAQYKRATHRFLAYMRQNAPPEMVSVQASSSDNSMAAFRIGTLMDISEWMVQQNHPMHTSILRALRLSIRVRSRVAESVFGGGDKGHQHFLEVLRYCWSLLVQLPRSTEPLSALQIPEDADDDDFDREANRFGVLKEEEEVDVEEWEEASASDTPMPVHRPAAEPELSTLDKVTNGEDYADASLFLFNLDSIMENVAKHFRMLNEQERQYKSMNVADNCLIENLLETAVATNMVIQHVQQLESELILYHPHLNTPYRVLAALVFARFVADMMDELRPFTAKSYAAKDIIGFLGDCLECRFRDGSDPCSRTETIVHEFCQEFQVSREGARVVQQYFDSTEHRVMFEVPAGDDILIRTMFEDAARSLGHSDAIPPPHSWLRDLHWIGQDRSIHRTIRLLQVCGNGIQLAPPDAFLEYPPGSFGPPFVPGQATGTKDLDDYFMVNILCDWLHMCQEGIVSESLPREDEICPLLVVLRSFVENPEKPVSWTLAFSVHAIMTAILETQNISQKIAALSKEAFNQFFDSVEWASKLHTEVMGSDLVDGYGIVGEQWESNLDCLAFLRDLGSPEYSDHCLWNPLCGGTILSHVCFYANIEIGCKLLDSFAQLKTVLFLYRGMILHGGDDIPALEILYNAFKSSKAIWEEGPLPERGELVQRWFIVNGVNYATANQLAEEAKEGQTSANLVVGRPRQVTTIDPAALATCYRRICMRDFQDIVDTRHTKEYIRRMKNDEIYQCFLRVNDTKDALYQEQDLLAFNLVTCAAIFDCFVLRLASFLQWEPPPLSVLVENGESPEEAKRKAFIFFFGQHVLGGYDFWSESSSRYRFVLPTESSGEKVVPLGAAISAYVEVFEKTFLDPEKMLWFSPLKPQSDNSAP